MKRRDELCLERSDAPERIPLETGHRYVIGGAPEHDVHLPGVEGVVGVLDVRPGKKRTSPATQPRWIERTHVHFTPYWRGADGQEVPDPAAEARLEEESTLEFAGVRLTLLAYERAGPERRPRALWTRLGRLFPAAADRRRSRLSRLDSGRPGRQQELFADFGALVDPAEARVAASVLARGRRASWLAVALMAAACIAAFRSTSTGVVPGTAAALTIGLLGIALVAVASSFYFAGVGPLVLTLAGASAVVLLPLPDPANVSVAFIVLLIPSAWQIGKQLDLAWFPIPSEDRWFDAALNVVGIVVIAAFILYLEVRGPLGPGAGGGSGEVSAAPVLIWASVLLAMLLIWTFVVVPRVQNDLLASNGRGRASLRRLWGARVGRVTKDALVLAEFAWLRLQRRTAARTVAVVLAVLPLLAILNRFDLQGRTGLLGATTDSAAVVVWSGPGRVVTDELLQESDWLVLSTEQWDSLGYPMSMFGLTTADENAGGQALASFAVRSVDDLVERLDAGGHAWLPAAAAAAPLDAAPVFRRAFVWSTTPWRIARADLISKLLSGFSLTLVFLGVLILWRAYERGAAAWLAALWAFGAGGLSPVLPFPGMSVGAHVGLQPIHESILALALSGPTSNLLFAAFTILWGVFLLLPLLVLGGLLPAMLVVEWVIAATRAERPSSGSEGGSARATGLRTAALRAGAPAIVVLVWFGAQGASIVINRLAPYPWIENAVLCLMPLVVLYAIHRAGTALLGPSKATLGHLLFIGLPWLVFAAVLAAGRPGWSGTVGLVAVGILSATTFVLAVWIVLWKNTWRIGGSTAGLSLAAAVVLPIAFLVVENVTSDLLVRLRIVPDAATGLATLIVFGLLLQPLVVRLRRLVDLLLLDDLRKVVPEMPRMISLLLSAHDSNKARAVREVLEGPTVGLSDYVVYARRGAMEGRFAPLAFGDEDTRVRPPDLVLSPELLRRLAGDSGFIDLGVALHEPEHTVVAPELWRVMRRLEMTTGRRWSDDAATSAGAERWYFRYLLPITIDDTLCGMLIVGADALDETRRREQFARRIVNLGLAAV